jgi:hypothetical protein
MSDSFLADEDPRTSLCLDCGEKAEATGTHTFAGGLSAEPCSLCSKPGTTWNGLGRLNARYDLNPSTQHQA